MRFRHTVTKILERLYNQTQIPVGIGNYLFLLFISLTLKL